MRRPAAPAAPSIWQRLARMCRHRWSEGAVRRALPDDALERLTRRVAASERRHTGQIRICIEGGLPWSYLLRGACARERAVTQFGKLRVWDTEHNNGVLIYLLHADHAIEIVADRALARVIPPQAWRDLVADMGAAFRARRHEEGLTEALAEVSALLVEHFPAVQAEAATGGSGAVVGGGADEGLPDAPVMSRRAGRAD
ncbi:hypothetical protein ASF94_17810 [Acidovorax sp. Leaf160]|nr:hypothetical protein ASF94_17810 [Acidovorax sp. Leaf160]